MIQGVLRAYHNDPAIKEKYINRVRAHRLADELVHGIYWQDGTGCAVGCCVETNDDPHEHYEEELGIPRVLAFLEDAFFENMPKGKAQEWPEAFLSSIAVGADLSQVIDHFMIWLLIDEQDGVIRFIDEQDGVIRFIDEDKAVVQHVASLYQRRLADDPPTEEEWAAARAAARDAARAAAWAAAWAAARDAARAAAWAAARDAARAAAWDAARDAARAAARAAAWDAARDAARAAARAAAFEKHYDRMADKLLELLAQAPAPVPS